MSMIKKIQKGDGKSFHDLVNFIVFTSDQIQRNLQGMKYQLFFHKCLFFL